MGVVDRRMGDDGRWHHAEGPYPVLAVAFFIANFNNFINFNEKVNSESDFNENFFEIS